MKGARGRLRDRPPPLHNLGPCLGIGISRPTRFCFARLKASLLYVYRTLTQLRFPNFIFHPRIPYSALFRRGFPRLTSPRQATTEHQGSCLAGRPDQSWPNASHPPNSSFHVKSPGVIARESSHGLGRRPGPVAWPGVCVACRLARKRSPTQRFPPA